MKAVRSSQQGRPPSDPPPDADAGPGVAYTSPGSEACWPRSCSAAPSRSSTRRSSTWPCRSSAPTSTRPSRSCSGGHRVHADAGGVHPRRRVPGRPARPAPRVRVGHRGLRGDVAVVRDRDVGGHRRHRTGARTSAGRAARRGQLAADVPRQPAGRSDRARPPRPVHLREPGPAGLAPHRPRRRGPGRGRAGSPDRRPRRGRRRRRGRGGAARARPRGRGRRGCWPGRRSCGGSAGSPRRWCRRTCGRHGRSRCPTC